MIEEDFSTEGTSTISKTSSLDVGKMMEAVHKIYDITESPFKNLLMEHGYNPETDAIVFSKEAAELIGLDKDNIPPRMKDRIHIDMNGYVGTFGYFLIRVAKLPGWEG